MRYFFLVLLLALAVSFSAAARICAATEPPTLLIFSAEWCPACTTLKDALAANPDTLSGVSAVFVDIDANADLAQVYGVRVVPTLVMLLADGKQRRYTGAPNVKTLKKWLTQKN